MPTLILLTIAYQIENKKWRYLFLALAAINLCFNIFHRVWLEEIYSVTIAILLFMLNPYFIVWWKNRDNRNNPNSFLQFLNETYLIAKHNKFKIFYWVSTLIISIVAVCFYTGYTGYALLGWLLGVFIILYILKNLFYSILPPEWFLHDINTGYVYLSVFIAWGAAYVVRLELGTNFIIPMLFAVAFSFVGFFMTHKNTRYLIPGCALVLADIPWQIIRFMQNNLGYTPQVITTEIVLIVVMVIGLIWLIRKPGILPITYLALFQLFRFSGFTYQAVDRVSSSELSAFDVTYYILYLVCWMYIVPLLFWFTGLMQQKGGSDLPVEKRAPRSNEKFFASLKKS